MDAWMERWMEGWMDGLMDEVTKTSSKLLFLHFWGEAELFTFHDPQSIIALIKWMCLWKVGVANKKFPFASVCH